MKSLPGILVGLALGAVLGILLAPDSGRKTRKRLSSESDSFFKDLQDQLQSGLDNIRRQYNDYVDSAAARSQDMAEQVKRRAKS